MNKAKPVILSHTILVALTVSSFGLGPRIPEQDTRGMARGNAFVATADNPSAVYFNPAGISMIYQGATLAHQSGPLTIILPAVETRQNSDVGINFLQHIVICSSYRPTAKWNLEVNADWADWDNLNTLFLHQKTGDIALDFNYESSWMYNAGANSLSDSGLTARAWATSSLRTQLQIIRSTPVFQTATDTSSLQDSATALLIRTWTSPSNGSTTPSAQSPRTPLPMEHTSSTRTPSA